MNNKSMTTTPHFILGLQNILDELVKNNDYAAVFNNTTIVYQGITEDTANGKFENFKIIRKV